MRNKCEKERFIIGEENMNLKEVFDFYKGKKVLVTGHTGFKGTWLSRILVNAGAKVTGYSLKPPTDPALFQMAGLEGKMNSVIGDIRDLAHLKQVFEETKPEIVLHLAAQPIVRDSYRDPVYTYKCYGYSQYSGMCPLKSLRKILLKCDNGQGL